jgi:hypothetical protein
MIAKAFTWFIAYVVPCFMLFGGLAGLWISTGYLVDAYSSSVWPRTTGTVIRSELGSESDSRRSADRTHYWSEVEYEYDVDGKTFQSSNVTLDGLRSGPHVGTGKTQAEDVLSRYPIDAQVGVHYDPDSPGRAVLETGISPDNFFVPVFTLVLTVIGSAWLWFMLFSGSGGSGRNEQWSGKERVCPKCQTNFTSMQDKGGCPKCHHVFFASKIMDIQEDT